MELQLPSLSALLANLPHSLVNDETIKRKLYKLSSPVEIQNFVLHLSIDKSIINQFWQFRQEIFIDKYSYIEKAHLIVGTKRNTAIFS